MDRRKGIAHCLLGAALAYAAAAAATEAEPVTPPAHGAALYSVVEQATIEASYHGIEGSPGVAAYTPQPRPNVPIVAGAAGNALGMAAVAAITKASNHRFAEEHVAPLRDGVRSVDLRGALQQAIHDAIGGVAWVDPAAVSKVNGPLDRSTTVGSETAYGVLRTRYTLSPDFTTLVLRADLDFYQPRPGENDARWRSKPAFHTLLIYQSETLQAPAKTPADIDALVEAENAHWNQGEINKQIAAVNAAGMDPTMQRKRHELVTKISRHEDVLRDARAPDWTPGTRADKLASLWAEHDAARLKQAIEDGGQTIARLMNMALATTDAGTAAAAPGADHHVAIVEGERQISSDNDGNLYSTPVASPNELAPYATGE